jgi:hypothetical protein
MMHHRHVEDCLATRARVLKTLYWLMLGFMIVTVLSTLSANPSGGLRADMAGENVKPSGHTSVGVGNAKFRAKSRTGMDWDSPFGPGTTIMASAGE